MNKKSNLVIPVYLNQRMVFDLIAMMQGGISTVTRISEMTHDKTHSEIDAGISGGLTDALASLVKIGLSANVKEKSEDESGIKLEEERTHTPASLFFTLRELLIKEGVVLGDDKIQSPGSFIEFSTTLTRNPVIEVIDGMHQIMELATIFGDMDNTKKPSENP